MLFTHEVGGETVFPLPIEVGGETVFPLPIEVGGETVFPLPIEAESLFNLSFYRADKVFFGIFFGIFGIFFGISGIFLSFYRLESFATPVLSVISFEIPQ